MTKQLSLICMLIAFLLFTSLAFGFDVHFQWGASTGVVDGYRIYNGAAGGPYPEMMGEVNGTTLDCMVSLDEATEYYLICRAFNIYGESGNSNEVHWSYNVPGIPGNLIWSINLTKLLESLGADRVQFTSE